MKDETIDAAVSAYARERHEFDIWGQAVLETLRREPTLHKAPMPVVHSIKWRLKDPDHLRAKLHRKWNAADPVTADNIFARVTDLFGVRVLHLHHAQFPEIHKRIVDRVQSGDWRLGEKPVAYSWDPETRALFENLDLRVEIKESYYTSIHYLIRSPNERSRVCVEVQVRTLFEEIWGEVDHAINYPDPTGSLACREQIKVLARLVSTGTRLANAIFTTHDEHLAAREKELEVAQVDGNLLQSRS